MSKNADWILQCIGIYQDSDYLDKIEEDFQIKLDLSDDETTEFVQTWAPNVGNRMAEMMYDKIIDKAVKELDTDREDFDYFCNGSLDTNLYYKQEEVYCWEDIVELANKSNNH